METFPRYWRIVRGIHRSPVNSLHKGQWRGALMFSLVCNWTNSWANNGDAGDLKHYRAHCNVHFRLGQFIFWSKYINLSRDGWLQPVIWPPSTPVILFIHITGLLQLNLTLDPEIAVPKNVPWHLPFAKMAAAKGTFEISFDDSLDWEDWPGKWKRLCGMVV